MLHDVFRLGRVLASNATPSPVGESELGDKPVVRQAVAVLPQLYRDTAEALAPLELAPDLEDELGPLADPRDGADLIGALWDRHDRVQDGKGKRSWFERDGERFAIRPVAQLQQAFEERWEFLHPYRIDAMRAFARDLLPSA